MMTHAGVKKLDDLRVRGGLRSKIPWGGRSPRVLTAAWERFRFVRETATLDEWPPEQVVEEQYRRFIHGGCDGGEEE